MARNKEDKRDLVYLIHSGPEEISQEDIDLYYVDDPGEQDPVEDTNEIVQ